MSLETAIFGDEDPVRAIVAFLDEEPAETLFVEASVGVVAGFRLRDGRGIVVKVHQPTVSVAYLRSVHAVQAALADAGFPAPRPLGEPRPLARGYATVEELLDGGDRRDGHDASVRRAMARALAGLVELAPDVGGIAGGILERTDAVWPQPHSPIFDFEATRHGTEWIDEYAERSRSRPAGKLVIGHGDWSVKHFRFAGDEITAIYDWDSLIRTDEPRIVGQAAATHPATWYIPTTVLATPAEARAFVAEYEEARGRSFTRGERARLAAAATYNVAYGARCESCGDPTATSFAEGSQRDTLARYGEEYLRL